MNLTNKNVLLINFSGRKTKGNCSTLIEHIISFGKPKNYSVVSFKELSVNPCTNCTYECFFSKNCPNKEDDLGALFRNALNFDIIVHLIPIYCGNLSALFQIYNERSQFYFMNESYFKSQSKIKRIYIVVGNLSPSFLYRLIGTKKRTFIASSHKYNLKSISGNLLKSEEFIKNFDAFLEQI